MWRDRWFKVGLGGSILACLVRFTPLAALALGLGAWTGYLDAVFLPALAAFVLLAAYRYWITRRGGG